MIDKGWRIWLAASFAAMIAGGAGAQGGQAVFDPVVEATVRINATSTGREGTGWVIEGVDAQNRAGAAVIVTSYNIIEGSSEIRVREPGSTEYYFATVLGTDSDRNLAFLEVKDIKASPLTLTRTAPRVGGDVYATGYNKAADEAEGTAQLAANASLKGGKLSRELRGPISTEARAEVNQLEYDATLLPGFEGGPLVDECARVVGVTMKSGAVTTRRAFLLIKPPSAVMNALKSDEIIKAANDKRVKLVIRDGECGSNVAAVPPAQPSPQPKSVEPTLTDRIGGVFGSGSSTLLALAALLGFAAAAFGIYALTRRNQSQVEDWQPPAPPPVTDIPPTRDATGTAASGTVAIGETKAPESQLRLSGRAPSGDPIDLTFSSTALTKGGVMLGVGANADVRIPDNRPDHRVSRLHARIAHDGRTFTIEDNKSLNKTFVGGRAIESHVPTPLVNGDRIKLADIELAVSVS